MGSEDTRDLELLRLEKRCLQLERELALKDALVSAILEQARAGYVVVEAPDMRVSQASMGAVGVDVAQPVQVQGLAYEDHLGGCRLLRSNGAPFLSHERPLDRAVREGQHTEGLEAVLEHPDGQRRWVLVNAAPVRKDGGDILAGVAVFHDITWLKDIEAERIQGLTFFAHDMKSPLIGARSFVQRLLEGKAGSLQAGQREELQIVMELLDRVLAMAMDFLDIARMGAAGFKIRLEPLQLEPLLESLAREFSSRAAQKGLVFSHRLEAGLRTVRGDSRRLERVLVNLLDNALKYAEAGEVRLYARNGEENWLIVEVHDDGPGLSAQDLENLFKTFHRGEASDGTEGTGLGLAAARSIVEAHGGCICAANRFPQGACFTLLLPVSE